MTSDPTTDPAVDFTVDELIVATIADLFDDGDQVCNGLSSSVPVCAIRLAPKVRLPGTAALADMGSLAKDLVYWVPDHSPRALVERVDFRSGIGYLDGHGERARLGIGGGPIAVITNLAIFDFEPSTERMRLQSVHSGVGIDQALEATGFEPAIAETVTVTPAPSQQQVDLIRHPIDPAGYRKRGFR